VALGTCEGANEVQRRTAVSMVVAAACFACRRAARVWPKSAGAAELKLKIRRPGGVRVCEIEREERGGGGVFMGGLDLDEGLGFQGGVSLIRRRRRSCARARLCEKDDRWASPVSL
jgi:hypothetical protein